MVVAAACALLARIFRQPLVIAYIVAGFLVGPSVLHIIHDGAAFESFSQIGIALLLFVIGLGLNIATIKQMSKPSLLSFGMIIIGVMPLGLAASWLLGLSPKESLVMSTALLFSSTIIVIKSLSDRQEQTRLHGRLAIGILLTDDLAATIALIIISALTGNGGTVSDLAWLLVKGAALGVGLALVGGLIMPRLSKLFASSQELLYVFALAWAFGVASTFYHLGFSLEVGALFAGVSLAHLPYVQSIASRLKPLRDFFLVLFFISLGKNLHLDGLWDALFPALIFSAIVLTAKPFMTQVALGLLGYTKQTGFKAALNLSQISEFSIIFIALAVSTHVVGDRLLSIGTLTAFITIAISAYLMKYDNKLYRIAAKPLSVFERSETRRELRNLSHYPLVLLGYREGGYSYVQTFRDMKKHYVVVDYDPDVIETLERQHINNVYGDATDLELLDEIDITRAELVVSTIADPATNRMLATHITRNNRNTVFICHTAKLDDAGALYEAGATYVILPHFISDMRINQFIQHHGSDQQAFAKHRLQQITSLNLQHTL